MITWQCCQQSNSAYHTSDLTTGESIAERVPQTLHTCPISKVARLGPTLRCWREQFLGCFTTDRSDNGGTEATRSPDGALTAGWLVAFDGSDDCVADRSAWIYR